jgi:hypothetical protein
MTDIVKLKDQVLEFFNRGLLKEPSFREIRETYNSVYPNNEYYVSDINAAIFYLMDEGILDLHYNEGLKVIKL